MPHQCVRCNSFYEDQDEHIIKGCTCGGKLFFFVKPEFLDKAKQQVANLSLVEKKQIENDVFDIMGAELDKEAPVILDLESVKVIKPGKFEIDLVHLFDKQHPVIYKLEEGKYMIDIANSMEKVNDVKKR
ncbi:hypothetical protein J4206_00385 [Candidatus Woesearchaeota archaeon]|nr:hypothetical protein [Candidatus Woesearchaeota archaeon]